MTEQPSFTSILPLDMGQFNTLTGGKNSHQGELLSIFFMNVDECLNILEQALSEKNNTLWHDATDELFHVSSSLGALELAKICAVASKITGATAQEKAVTLENIRANVQKLRVFTRNTSY